MLDNCGIDGKEFGDILNGLAQLPDFKSIIYKQNSFTKESLTALEALLDKKVPYHLEELKLVDLKIQ